MGNANTGCAACASSQADENSNEGREEGMRVASLAWMKDDAPSSAAVGVESQVPWHRRAT